MDVLYVWAFVAISAVSVVQGKYEGSYNPCSSNPCGQNTQCFVSSNRPVCSCQPGHWGDPLTYCQRGECQDNNDCPSNKGCKQNHCVDVCSGTCGPNADCRVRNHVPVCSCPPGYKGDPVSNCRLMDPQELCIPSPCGANTKCEVVNGTPICACLPGYFGAPLSGCRHECENDYDCSAAESCQNFKCKSPCATGACASTANCNVRNHRAVCSCPAGYTGDPYVSCRTECLSSADCPSHKASCLGGKCVDVCAGVCGVNAICKVRDGTTAICSCPKDMTGNPFHSCRPFEPRDLCIPNPCGTNARCEPGHDRTGLERPVCTCISGYQGDPLKYCRPGECSVSEDCRYDQNCVDNKCVSSCNQQCGVGAVCNGRNHVAVCTCPPGYTGDALTRCYTIPRPVARYLSNKK